MNANKALPLELPADDPSVTYPHYYTMKNCTHFSKLRNDRFRLVRITKYMDGAYHTGGQWDGVLQCWFDGYSNIDRTYLKDRISLNDASKIMQKVIEKET